jgi:hypothetical protein
MASDSSYNLIEEDAWNKAGWSWTAFLVTQDSDAQPGIGLMFKDHEAGIKIFQKWAQRFGGAADRQNLLRVGIVDGTHPKRGDGYSITFTTDMHSLPAADGPDHYSAVGIRWRFHDTRGQNQSLTWFKASVQRHGMFFLVPLPLKPSSNVEEYFPHMIRKSKVYISEYGSIDQDSQDRIVLAP